MNRTTYMMYITFWGDDFNLKEMTEKLKLTPCYTMKRGEKIRNTGRRHQNTGWTYKNNLETLDLNTQIEELETIFTSKFSEIYFLRKKNNLTVSIEPVISIENDEVSSMYFNHGFIKFAADIGACLALDVYINPPELWKHGALSLSDEPGEEQQKKTSIEAIFVISGDARASGDIVNELGIGLSELERGKVNGDVQERADSIWQYSTREEETWYLSTQINKLKKIFMPRKGRLRRLKAKYSLKYVFEFKINVKNDDLPGLYIDAQFVKFAAKIGAGIRVDIRIDAGSRRYSDYCWYAESNQE